MMMKIEKLLTISDKILKGKKTEIAKVQDFDKEDIKNVDKTKFKKGKSQRGVKRLESKCFVILKEDFEEYERDINSQIEKLKNEIAEKDKSIESLQNQLSNIDEVNEEEIKKLDDDYSEEVQQLKEDLHEKDLEIERTKTEYEKKIGELKIFDEDSHMSIAEHQKEIDNLELFDKDKHMTIKDPNEIVARLYPTSTVAAGSGAPLTIRQPDGTNAVYDGSNAVTADARPKTLTIKQPDGSDVAYNGSAATSVDTRPAVLEIKKPDGSSTYYDGSAAVSVNTQGKTLTVNNSDGTTTTFNGSANKTVTIPSTLPPTPGTLRFEDFTPADKLRWAAVASAASYVGEFTDNVVNVKFMGAKGDGVTDDTDALIDAFDSISGTGGVVYFPPGEYVIGGGGSGKYVEFYSGTRIIGVPGKSVLIYADALADHGTSWEKPKSLLRNHTTNTEGRYTGTHDVLIDGLVFDGNPRIPKSSTALGIGHAQNITVRNCIFRNHFSLIHNSHYIEINASRHVVVDGCIFEPEYHYANSISDKSKWDCIYAEYINLDRASTNSYGASSYYVWDNTEPDDIEILNNKFMSFPSDYWSHPRQLGDDEVYWTAPAVDPSRTAANVFYGLAIGGHADYGENYAGNRGEAGTNVKIHDNLFLGDWNS